MGEGEGRARGGSVASDHGWWPYLAPYAGFLVLVEIARRAPEAAAGPLLGLRVLLPGGLLLFFAARGAYPELRGWRPGAGRILADLGFGLAVTALWMAPYLLGILPLPGDPGTAFDPTMLGPEHVGLTLGLRFAGFALVTPFMEELFVRSFLMRLVDAYTGRGPADFRRAPIGRFAGPSFAVTVLWFTFTHVSWEWPVAFATGVLYNLWLYHRRHIASLVLVHAVTNASLFLAVLLGSGRIPDGQGGTLDLWFFL